MRLLPALCLLTACVVQRPPIDEPPIDEPFPPPGPVENCNRTCFTGEVCARDHLCHPESEVRSIRSMWSVRGAPASPEACGVFPDLYIRFEALDDSVGYSPVPCKLGLFTMDKLPTTFTQVELGIDGPDGRFGDITHLIQTDGTVAFDLMP